MSRRARNTSEGAAGAAAIHGFAGECRARVELLARTARRALRVERRLSRTAPPVVAPPPLVRAPRRPKHTRAGGSEEGGRRRGDHAGRSAVNDAPVR